MASLMFSAFKNNLLAGDIDFTNTVVKAYLVDTGAVTITASTALADIQSASLSSAIVTGVARAYGYLESDDITFVGVSGTGGSGDIAEGVVLTVEDTSEVEIPMSWHEGVVTPDGGNIIAECPADGWWTLDYHASYASYTTSFLFRNFINDLMASACDLESDTLTAYLFTAAHWTSYVNGIGLGSTSAPFTQVGSPMNLSGKNIIGNAFDCNDIQFTSVAAGDNVVGMLVYNETRDHTVCWNYGTVTTDGGNINVIIPSGGLFEL